MFSTIATHESFLLLPPESSSPKTQVRQFYGCQNPNITSTRTAKLPKHRTEETQNRYNTKLLIWQICGIIWLICFYLHSKRYPRAQSQHTHTHQWQQHTFPPNCSPRAAMMKEYPLFLPLSSLIMSPRWLAGCHRLANRLEPATKVPLASINIPGRTSLAVLTGHLSIYQQI